MKLQNDLSRDMFRDLPSKIVSFDSGQGVTHTNTTPPSQQKVPVCASPVLDRLCHTLKPHTQPDMTSVEAQAGQDLSTTLLIIPLLKDVQFHEFNLQLKRAAFHFRWPDHILDITMPEANVPADGDLTHKQRCDVRNAYTAITLLCMGHDVAETLESADMGDAREAYKLLHHHFHRSTTASRGRASVDFYRMTMTNTNTDVVKFLALAKRNSRILSRHDGHVVSEAALRTVILGGLLVEFDPIKNLILYGGGGMAI